MKKGTKITILLLFSIGILYVEGQHHRFSDLFFDNTFFLGVPPSIDERFEPYVRSSKDIPPEEIIELADDIKDADAGIFTDDLWPGNDFEVTDPGPEVVKVFKDNLKGRMENLDQNSDSTSELSGRTEACLKEKKTCFQPYCFSCQEVCTIRCLVKQNDLFKDLSTLLQKSMKYFCRTAHTFFLRLEDFKVKSYDDFKALLTKVVPKTITTNQAAIRAMLVKLIRETSSPLVRLRPLFDLFEELVKPTHKQIGIEDKVLIGNHPGCAMVDMQQPIDKMVELINKDHSLLDYIIFQGYALFTSVSKYVADFQSKKPFVALNSGLDILIGTTCGLHKYAMTGQKSNCDQVGGFPTLGMPLPKWMWKPKTHKACQQVKNIVMWGPKGSLPTDMEIKDDTDEKKTVRRKRLTLKVDPKNIKH